MHRRMRITTFLCASVCCWATVGCATQSPASKNVSNSPKSSQDQPVNDDQFAELSLVLADRQTLDEAVIEAALVDLMDARVRESWMLRYEQGRGKLLFSGDCQNPSVAPTHVFSTAEQEEWHTLVPSDLKAAKSAAAVIEDRLRSNQCFKLFRPSDPRITLWEDTPASTQPTNHGLSLEPQPIRAFPPGYGDQNRLSVVVFEFPWSKHYGHAVYVLRYEAGCWHAVSRKFLYYL